MSKVLNDWSASQRASIIGEAVLFSFKIMFDLGDADLVFDPPSSRLHGGVLAAVVQACKMETLNSVHGPGPGPASRSVGGLPQDSFQHYQFSP